MSGRPMFGTISSPVRRQYQFSCVCPAAHIRTCVWNLSPLNEGFFWKRDNKNCPLLFHTTRFGLIWVRNRLRQTVGLMCEKMGAPSAALVPKNLACMSSKLLLDMFGQWGFYDQVWAVFQYLHELLTLLSGLLLSLFFFLNLIVFIFLNQLLYELKLAMITF